MNKYYYANEIHNKYNLAIKNKDVDFIINNLNFDSIYTDDHTYENSYNDARSAIIIDLKNNNSRISLSSHDEDMEYYHNIIIDYYENIVTIFFIKSCNGSEHPIVESYVKDYNSKEIFNDEECFLYSFSNPPNLLIYPDIF